jgi:hypothetical protein
LTSFSAPSRLPDALIRRLVGVLVIAIAQNL